MAIVPGPLHHSADVNEDKRPLRGRRLSAFHPYIDGEVRYAVRHEYAETAVDVVARRTRLASLNAQAALEALPDVTDIMTVELGWNEERREREWIDSVSFLTSMGLPSGSCTPNNENDEKARVG